MCLRIWFEIVPGLRELFADLLAFKNLQQGSSGPLLGQSSKGGSQWTASCGMPSPCHVPGTASHLNQDIPVIASGGD